MDKYFQIYSTKECVSQCPETIPYQSFQCISIDFTEQEYGQTLQPQCTPTQLDPPKYPLSSYCYESCPPNSEINELLTTAIQCQCIKSWHKEPTTDERICDDEEYCKYNEYKYKIYNTNECANDCPLYYNQFNFQCYLGFCPEGTTETESSECVSNYQYCYVDEYYQNICSDELVSPYIYKFDNTNQYLKSCSESINYTTENAKTYLYNGVCYLSCPENTSNNDEKNICDCLYFGYYSETDENDYICYNEEEKCVDKIPVIDLKICLDIIEDCIIKGYKIFNNECYNENCPENTEIKNSNDNNCYCKNYYYNNNGILECYDPTITSCEEKGYEYSNPLTLECFNSLEDCYNKNNIYFFNKYCYKDTCSDYIALSSISDEEIRNDFIVNLNIANEYLNRICVCNIFNPNINWDFTVSDDGVYTQECVSECQDEYEPNSISNRCIESCLSYKHYVFNDECYYEGCPENTRQSVDNAHICICENYFLNNDNNELECYNTLEDCQSNGILYYNEEAKQCFSSLNNCFANGFNKYFNKMCYNNVCPTGKISLMDIEDDTIKNEFINLLGINDDLIDKICVCNTISDENLKWTFDTTNEEQECVNICDNSIYEVEPEPITHKCIEKCNPLTDFVFNDICYKYNCPEGTKLKNDGTRDCICENSYYISKENNHMICCTNENEDDINCIEKILYPQEYYENPDKCLAVYNNKCYLECPEGTCLTPKDANLIFCVKTQAFMTVFNHICFTDFNEIELNIKSISDKDLYIMPSQNITIKAYSTESEIDEINSNYSYVKLGECEYTLKYHYNLLNDTVLYIIGVESPSKNKKSSVNAYDYGVYLENGTKLNLSICDGNSITIYSIITNTSLIKLDEANYFSSYGYDIYNESSDFYTDVCSPASIDGNDVTLTDRKIDFYPSDVSFCNEGCEFQLVNLTSEKIKCSCDAVYDNNIAEEEEEEEEEFTYTYLEYFLSLVNYKIIFCQKLLLIPSNYLENIGFYVGGIITLICIIQMFININFGMRSLNKIIIENEPSKAKYEEKKKERLNKIKEYFESQKESTNNNIIETSKKINDKKMIESKNIDYISSDAPPSKKKRCATPKDSPNRLGTETFNMKKGKNRKNLKVLFESKKDLSKKDIPFIKVNDNLNKRLNFLELKSKQKNQKNQKIQTPKKEKEKEVYTTEALSLFSKSKLNKAEKKSNKKVEKIDSKENKKSLSQFLNSNPLIDDEDIDKKELNDVPYTKALRIDKRSFCEILLYTVANKIEIINIFFYKNIYVHLSMSISLYLFSFLLDVALNCFLYTDDVVSEKYHNEGSLEMLTSLSLSFASNIISSIITYFLGKLGEYSDILDIMTHDICLKRYYYMNIIKFKKYLKIRLSLFYFFQFIMCIIMTYYITIFCVIYNKSQISIMINYIYGVLESLGISIGITLVIAILRYLSIKNKWINIYRTSQYIYNKF